MKTSSQCLFLFLLPILSYSLLATARFDLQVNDVSGLNEPWPLIGGLPFAEGEITDAENIRIVDQSGREVPAQIDVVARWRDGSIRWAQAGMTASPQGRYQVEYGAGVSRAEVAAPLIVDQRDDGGLTVDTGVAVYSFRPNELLPDSASINGITVFSDSGAGAYLVDNRGRTARVAGELAEVVRELIVLGPTRAVVRSEGWYIGEDGEQMARAKVWFYLAAGSPALRITHSLIFTRDTNELWVSDYGLEFTTGRPANEAMFGFKEPAKIEVFRPMAGGQVSWEDVEKLAEIYSEGLYQVERELFRTTPGEDEVYLLQEDYPHMLKREFLAVIGRVPANESSQLRDVLWNHSWLKLGEVGDDWGEARYGNYALAVATPQLAQRFPKEIAIGPTGVRVALWSGRSGRELDFRAAALVNDYWQDWSNFSLRPPNRGLIAAEYSASHDSNAMGAARTHDVWVMPRSGAIDDETLQQQMAAASHAPLLQADPQWLTATGAIGYPMHPAGDERFVREDEVLRELWTGLMGGTSHNAGLRRSGFVSWGGNPNLHGYASWFRISRMTDYNLRRGVWNLYARSGDRSYYDFGARFNQFAGDWELGHWQVGDKFPGGFSTGTDNSLPLHWGSGSALAGSNLDVTGHTVMNWLLEYYLTGNEHSAELISMIADAYRQRGEAELNKLMTSHIYVLGPLYGHTNDEVLKRLVEDQVNRMIDPENLTGLSDEEAQYGVYYKTHRSLLALYDYYLATGDERARAAFLQGVEDKYRYHLIFDRTGQPGGRSVFDRSYASFLFAIAYNWTGRQAYLRLLNNLNESFREGSPRRGLMTQMNPFMGVPTTLAVLANVDEPIGPFPLLETDGANMLEVVKKEGSAVWLEVYVHTADDVDEQQPATVKVLSADGSVPGNVSFEAIQMFQTRDSGRRNPRRWFIRIDLPAELADGLYQLEFPHAARIAVLDANAAGLEWSGR